jgi:hypothetical protein
MEGVAYILILNHKAFAGLECAGEQGENSSHSALHYSEAQSIWSGISILWHWIFGFWISVLL